MPDFERLETRKARLLEAIQEYETETGLYLVSIQPRYTKQGHILDINYNFGEANPAQFNKLGDLRDD